MNITLERQSNCAAKLKVEVPADSVTNERKKIIQAFSNQARIKGYRPGKVPRTVIEKRYGTEITAEVESRLVQQALTQAAKDEELRILEAKPPEDAEFHPDGVMTFSTSLTLAPEFELPEYKGIELQIPDRVITDDDVNVELNNLRNRFADYNDITDRNVQSGDFVIIDYSSELDGKPLEEAIGQSVGYLAGSEGYWLKMDDDSLLPGFPQNLEGAATGEERSFAVEVPEEFAVEELRGLELQFTVTVKELKEQVLPELTDELAGQLLPDSDLNGLIETIRGNLEQQLNQQIEEFKINQLLEKLNQSVQFELPPEMVTAETQGQADDMVERGLGQGMSEDEIESRQEEIFAAANQRAQMSLRTDFLLQRISEEENVEVSQDELLNRVAAMANQAKKPIKSYAKELQQSGQLRSVQHNMLLSKTIDFLLEHAKVEVTADLPGASAPEDPSDSTDESANDDE